MSKAEDSSACAEGKYPLVKGYTPAHTAITYWDLPKLKYLININADLTAKNKDGHTPLEQFLNMVVPSRAEDIADRMRELLYQKTPNAQEITTGFYIRHSAYCEELTLREQFKKPAHYQPDIKASVPTADDTGLSQDIDPLSQELGGEAPADPLTE